VKQKETKTAVLQRRQAIVILGMHRSGTSAVAGVVAALGAGTPKTMMGTNIWNPRGYFESDRIVAAHEELLTSAGSYWHDWRQIDPSWFCSEQAEPHRRKIKQLIVEEFGDQSLIFVKDPRICRMVPFTASILIEVGYDPIAILPLRNPLEVARSLNTRDKFGVAKSTLLWLRHVLEAEYYSRKMPRSVLLYQELLSDWRGQVDRSARNTGILWPDRSAASDSKIDQFLTRELYHQRASFDELNDHYEIARWARDTYGAFIKIAAGSKSEELLDQLDRVRADFDDACRTFDAVLAEQESAAAAARYSVTVERDALAGAHANLTAKHDRALGEYQAALESAEVLVAERDKALREYQAALERAEALVAEREAALRDYGAALERAEALVAEREAALREYQAALARAEALVAERDMVLRKY
jgi:hypothetical protein